MLSRTLHHVDRPVHRLTRGRHTLASLLTGLPVILLTTTGARSGQRRSVPVLSLPTTDGLAVIASNYGRPHHPAWYHNLRANPEGEFTYRGATTRFRAREATGEPRARIWEQALVSYPGFTQYARRATPRRIGVFVLDAV